jgi:hypothetical protein
VSYALVPKGTDDVHLHVDVRGGQVTSAAWPACGFGLLVCGGGDHPRRPGSCRTIPERREVG